MDNPMPPFSGWRPAEPCPRNRRKCLVFHWVGQALDVCDGCGHPRPMHAYDPPYGGAHPIFYVRQYIEWRDQWVWMPVGSLIRYYEPVGPYG